MCIDHVAVTLVEQCIERHQMQLAVRNYYDPSAVAQERHGLEQELIQCLCFSTTVTPVSNGRQMQFHCGFNLIAALQFVMSDAVAGYSKRERTGRFENIFDDQLTFGQTRL